MTLIWRVIGLRMQLLLFDRLDLIPTENHCACGSASVEGGDLVVRNRHQLVPKAASVRVRAQKLLTRKVRKCLLKGLTTEAWPLSRWGPMPSINRSLDESLQLFETQPFHLVRHGLLFLLLCCYFHGTLEKALLFRTVCMVEH